MLTRKRPRPREANKMEPVPLCEKKQRRGIKLPADDYEIVDPYVFSGGVTDAQSMSTSGGDENSRDHTRPTTETITKKQKQKTEVVVDIVSEEKEPDVIEQVPIAAEPPQVETVEEDDDDWLCDEEEFTLINEDNGVHGLVNSVEFANKTASCKVDIIASLHFLISMVVTENGRLNDFVALSRNIGTSVTRELETLPALASQLDSLVLAYVKCIYPDNKQAEDELALSHVTEMQASVNHEESKDAFDEHDVYAEQHEEDKFGVFLENLSAAFLRFYRALTLLLTYQKQWLLDIDQRVIAYPHESTILDEKRAMLMQDMFHHSNILISGHERLHGLLKRLGWTNNEDLLSTVAQVVQLNYANPSVGDDTWNALARERRWQNTHHTPRNMLPAVFEFLSPVDVLTSRLVCRSWNHILTQRIPAVLERAQTAYEKQLTFFMYQRREEKFMIHPDFLTRQTDVQPHMRVILFNWIAAVIAQTGLSNDTFHLTCKLVDRVLSDIDVRRTQFQLIGTGCILVAAKLKEMSYPTIEHLIMLAGNDRTKAQVIEMECMLLQTLSFRLECPHTALFVGLLSGDMKVTREVSHVASYFVDLSLISPDLGFTPNSITATAAVILADFIEHRDTEGPDRVRQEQFVRQLLAHVNISITSEPQLWIAMRALLRIAQEAPIAFSNVVDHFRGATTPDQYAARFDLTIEELEDRLRSL